MSWLLQRVIFSVVLLSAIPPAFCGIWDANNINGTTLTDLSGEGVDGDIFNSTTELIDNRPVLNFSQGGYVTVPDTPGDDWPTISIFAEVYITAPGVGWKPVICRDLAGSSNHDVFGITHYWGSSQWMGFVRTTQKTAYLYVSTQPGWNYIGLTYDGSLLKLSLNGYTAVQTALSGTIVSEPCTPLVIGTYSDKSLNGVFKGRLAHVEVCREVLPTSYFAEEWFKLQDGLQNLNFIFAEAGDFHITDTKSIEIVNDAVDKINLRDVKFTLLAGDFTEDSSPDSMSLARIAFNRLTEPYHATPGNHDSLPNVYDSQFGTRNYVFMEGHWKFIMLDDAVDVDTYMPLPQSQLDWLRTVLDETDPCTPLVLCCHVPLMPGLYARSRLVNADDVLAMFQGYNLKAQISGHWHQNQGLESNGTLFTTTAALSTTRENTDGSTARGYRIFHCYDNGIATEFVKVCDYPPPPPVPPTPLSSDINGDGVIDFLDFSMMASHWLEVR